MFHRSLVVPAYGFFNVPRLTRNKSYIIFAKHVFDDNYLSSIHSWAYG